MAATTLTTERERLGTGPITQQVVLTNGIMGISINVNTSFSDSDIVKTSSLTLTADEAEALAAVLIAKASNVRNGIHDNEFGAR